MQRPVTQNPRAKLIAKFGFDPLDYSWVEELATSPLEQSWFKFQREQKGSFNDDWETTVKRFHNTHHREISVAEAFDLSRKWKRYIIGAWNTIAARNPNIEDWKAAAKKFEQYHHEIEVRMMEWTQKYKNKFSLAKVVKPVRFRHGPYFNECVERVPQLFTDATCWMIKVGVILEVLSFDPETKYIRLEFTPDVREMIKPGIPLNDPCRPLRADYIIYVHPEEVETSLEFLTRME